MAKQSCQTTHCNTNCSEHHAGRTEIAIGAMHRRRRTLFSADDGALIISPTHGRTLPDIDGAALSIPGLSPSDSVHYGENISGLIKA